MKPTRRRLLALGPLAAAVAASGQEPNSIGLTLPTGDPITKWNVPETATGIIIAPHYETIGRLTPSGVEWELGLNHIVGRYGPWALRFTGWKSDHSSDTQYSQWLARCGDAKVVSASPGPVGLYQDHWKFSTSLMPDQSLISSFSSERERNWQADLALAIMVAFINAIDWTGFDESTALEQMNWDKTHRKAA